MVQNENVSYMKKYKKEISWSFIVITIISAVIYVYSWNKILAVGLVVFLVLSIIAFIASLIVAAEDH